MKLKIFVFVQVFWLCTGFFGCLQDDIRLKNEKSGQRLIDYVDTRIGTGGLVSASGHTSPAISTPFGMVKPGPDTSTLGIITSSSGYHYGDMELVGFSQTRYFGTGSSEGGVLRLIPSNQSIENYESKNKIVHLFSHNHEVAEPGYYSVTTDNTGIFTEITSTDRVGVYNFNFSQTNDPVLILDVTSKLDGNKDFKDSRVVVDREKRTISGYTHLIGDFSSRYKGIRIYFYAQFDQAFADVVLSPQQKNLGNDISIKGQPLLVNLSFSETNQVGVKIGLSYTSEEKAKRNLKLEVGQRSFESVKIENQSRWETKLSKIQIEAEKNRKHIFYSALYRSYLMP
ncbi:MAG: glycoside hydrolase family 92 protein, partial [Bdellovibrionales bacterium]|nr:glycoside hydrolase family 92 protein [Bdellovibrionales bacterium]